MRVRPVCDAGAIVRSARVPRAARVHAQRLAESDRAVALGNGHRYGCGHGYHLKVLRTAVGSGQLGRWAVGGGQWAVGGGQWALAHRLRTRAQQTRDQLGHLARDGEVERRPLAHLLRGGFRLRARVRVKVRLEVSVRARVHSVTSSHQRCGGSPLHAAGWSLP